MPSVPGLVAAFPQWLEQRKGEMVQILLIAVHALLGVCQRLVLVWGLKQC